ncbi:MAG TPA: DUF2442 domain-containing protein [Anaerovoracaceae bacterium]|nr:DUF2442 domain-containing protein [Anaerovoracaceae bacterium]
MSRMISVQGSDDYKLLIDFEDGSNIAFNMQKLIKTIPYCRLKDPTSFQAVKFDEKSIYWDAEDQKPEYIPLRISIDSILFSLRD